MPEALERKLKGQAKKKFGSTTSERARKYIYGTMRKTGWIPSTQKKKKFKKHHSSVPQFSGIENYHDREIEIR